MTKFEISGKLMLTHVLALAIFMSISVCSFAQTENLNANQIRDGVRNSRPGRRLNKIPIQPFYPGPEWRTQMSEVLIGKTPETDALWTYAQQELAEAEPKAKPEEWTRYSIQRMNIGDVQFFLFSWVDLNAEGWADPGQMPWLLITKKKDQVVYRSFDNDSTKYAAPMEFGMINDTEFADALQTRKDTPWEKTCKRPLANLVRDEGYDFYRDCAALVRVQSRDGEAVVLRTYRLTNGARNHIWSFDAKTGELRSLVEAAGKFSNLDLHYFLPTKTLYLASRGLELKPSGIEAPITLRRQDAARAFALTRIGKFFAPCQSGLPGSCELGLDLEVYRRMALTSDARFLDDPSLPTNTAYMETELKYILSNADDSSIERRWGGSYKLRVIKISDTLGYFAAFNTRQRIIDEWNRIPKNVRQDIDPSEIALYWAAQGMESLLDAFPSTLLPSKENIK